MRRRLPLLLLPVAAMLFFFRPRVPSDHELVLSFGPRAADVREADLHFERDGETVRDLSLFFPRGATEPGPRRDVRLSSGDLSVGVRLVYANGSERHGTRAIHVEADGPIEIDLE